jgi:putative peptide zinc metalloprotease protein
MGFLLMYLLPAFYCNVSDAWLLEDKRKRLWVSFAGVFFQLFMWGAAAVVWRIADPETFLSDCAVLVMVTSGVSALFSLNPLIKLDGYYLLADWLEMPNLRKKAFAYLLSRMIPSRRRSADGAAEPADSEKRVYRWYGLAAVAYSFALVVFIVLKVAGFVVSRYHGAGLLGLAVVLILLFTGTFERWTMSVRGIFAERKGPGMKRRRLAVVLGVGAACVLVLVFTRWDLRITGRFILLPDARSTIRAEVDGILSEIYFDEGDSVRAGQTIARVDDSEYRARFEETKAEMAKGEAQLALLRKGPLEIEVDRLRKLVDRSRMQVSYAEKEFERVGELYRKNLVPPNEYEKAEQELSLSRKDLERSEGDLRVLAVGNRPETIREAEAEVDRLRASLEFLSQQIERTEIRSPLAGVVSTHRLKDRLKEYLETGDEICEVVSCGKMLLEMPVSEKDIVDVREGMAVKLKARSLPASSFAGRVVSVPPVAVDRMNRTVLIVTAEVDNPKHLLKPGMTGAARIYCGKHRLLDLLTRKIIRFVRVEFWWW